jgi:hypothetical protein
VAVRILIFSGTSFWPCLDWRGTSWLCLPFPGQPDTNIRIYLWLCRILIFSGASLWQCLIIRIYLWQSAECFCLGALLWPYLVWWEICSPCSSYPGRQEIKLECYCGRKILSRAVGTKLEFICGSPHTNFFRCIIVVVFWISGEPPDSAHHTLGNQKQ